MDTFQFEVAGEVTSGDGLRVTVDLRVYDSEGLATEAGEDIIQMITDYVHSYGKPSPEELRKQMHIVRGA